MHGTKFLMVGIFKQTIAPLFGNLKTKLYNEIADARGCCHMDDFTCRCRGVSSHADIMGCHHMQMSWGCHHMQDVVGVSSHADVVGVSSHADVIGLSSLADVRGVILLG